MNFTKSVAISLADQDHCMGLQKVYRIVIPPEIICYIDHIIIYLSLGLTYLYYIAIS